MTTEELRKLMNARPFAPFALRTADGRESRVSHPEQVAYGGGRIVVVVDGDEAEIIDLLLVPSARVSVAPPPSPPPPTEAEASESPF